MSANRATFALRIGLGVVVVDAILLESLLEKLTDLG